jgi:formylglycine-generating enzyme required for sulfatase activity
MMIAGIACSILPPGSYRVGARQGDRFAGAAELPLHTVELSKRVAVARDAVTERDYAPFAPAHLPLPGDLPLIHVSWREATAYCAWLGGRTGCPWRLPSEAEWEIACRAGSETPFSTGDTLPPELANYLYSESGERVGPACRTAPGTYPPNSWGLRDMHGNIAEWCADAWEPSHENMPRDGSPRRGGEDDGKVVRGGAWDLLPRLLRSSSRDSLPPHTRRDNLGFRLAVTLND